VTELPEAERAAAGGAAADAASSVDGDAPVRGHSAPPRTRSASSLGAAGGGAAAAPRGRGRGLQRLFGCCVAPATIGEGDDDEP
jgi:hypothetical protein